LFKILEAAHRLLPSYQAELAPFAERVLADLVDGLSSGGSAKTRERALAGLRALGRILVERAAGSPRRLRSPACSLPSTGWCSTRHIYISRKINSTMMRK
jgi:hypothetical protein